MNGAQIKLQKQLLNPFTFYLFKITRLPMLALAGIRIRKMDNQQCEVTIAYGYFTQNPFRSIYFACLAMAAELSSGVLALLQTTGRDRKISMLVTRLEADFTKKAVGKIRFVCADGNILAKAVNEALQNESGAKVFTLSEGFDEKNDKVAEFKIEWSFKAK